MALAILVTILLWPIGCSTQPTSPPAASLPETVMIVVPGLYGTQLVRDVPPKDEEAQTQIVWLSASEALFGRTSLMLPLPGMDGGDAVPLRVDGLLEHITIVPGIYARDVYGSLLDTLRASGRDRAAVLPFAYDWRLDVMAAVRDLAALVDGVRRQGANRIVLVAHSLGGLITSYYLRYGTQDPERAEETWEGARQVDKVVMAGVPFRGSMTMFRNFLYGWKVGWNRTLLSPTAYASFPVSYYLLPALDQDVLLSTDLKPVTGMVRDPVMWQRMGWGLLKGSDVLGDDVRELRARYTVSWLERAERFITSLHRPAVARLDRPVPLLYISGTDVPTLAKGAFLEEAGGGPNRIVFEPSGSSGGSTMTADLFVGDGDGSVTRESALLPSAYRLNMAVTSRTYRETHADLLASRNIQKEIQAFVEPER